MPSLMPGVLACCLELHTQSQSYAVLGNCPLHNHMHRRVLPCVPSLLFVALQVKVVLPAVNGGALPQPLLCVRKKLLKAGENNPNDPEKEVEALAASENNLLVTQMWWVCGASTFQRFSHLKMPL